MKSKRWTIWAGVLLLIALTPVTFFLANFSAMSSQLAHDSSLASSTGIPESALFTKPAKTGLIITGDNRLAQPLQAQIMRQLGNDPAFGQLQPLNSLVEKSGDPILLIEIAPQEIFWTPIFARAALKLTVSYASDGDVSFRSSQPVEFKHSDGQTSIKRSGIYTFSDVSWGIISSPGYMDYLSREIAKSIAADLKGPNG